MINPAIGLIVMSASTGVEREFHRSVPEGVDVVASRVPFNDLSYNGLVEMVKKMPETAKVLMEARPYVIVVPSFLAGTLKGTEIVNILQQVTGVPVLVPALEYLKLFKRGGITKIGVISVHSNELILLEKAFFSAHNVSIEKVVQVENKVNVDPYLISTISESALVEAARATDFSGVDAVIIDNSYFDMRGYYEELDQVIGKPVFAPSSVTLFTALEMIDAPRNHIFISKYFSKNAQCKT